MAPIAYIYCVYRLASFTSIFVKSLNILMYYLTDELIRQVTINCAERGLLLLRVRDEIRMTIAAYQTLYESSVAFGMRKALQAEQGKADMEKKVGGCLASTNNTAIVSETRTSNLQVDQDFSFLFYMRYSMAPIHNINI